MFISWINGDGEQSSLADTDCRFAKSGVGICSSCGMFHDASTDYAPLADACSECGSLVGIEEHDAACFSGWINDMYVNDALFTDDTTDMGDR